MTSKRPAKQSFLKRIADETGVAVVVLDRHGTEVSTANNNSICRALWNSPKFASRCEADCGKAFERAFAAGEPIDYTCHAGLVCKAIPVQDGGRNFVAIAGRTFLSSEKYKSATEKAVSGEWRSFRPTEFFENVLISGSMTPIEKVREKLGKFRPKEPEDLLDLVGAPTRTNGNAAPVPQTEAVFSGREGRPAEGTHEHESEGMPDVVPEPEPDAISKLIEQFNRDVRAGDQPAAPALPPPHVPAVAEASATRSLISSLIEMEYQEACETVLQHLAERFEARSFVWLELTESAFRSVAALGELEGRTIRINLNAENERLLDHAARDMPLELTERQRDRSDKPTRKMLLFPVQVGTQVRAAIGVQSGAEDTGNYSEISRLAKMIGPQIEILRLRNEVSSREWVSQSVRRFSESLRKIGSTDFWKQITETSAELLGAERASILVPGEGTDELIPKASVGSNVDLEQTPNLGNRVARVTFERGSPILVENIDETAIGRAPDDRRYRTGSFISFPIVIGDRRLAVMNFTDRADGSTFGEEDLELLQTIAPQIAVAIDHGRLKVRAGELERRSITDSLTGLMNRGYIEERLIEEMNQASRHRFPASLLMLDVDNFKSYNDTFGHPAGDIALVLVSNVLKETLRAADVAARYGGEEFAVLLPQTAAEEASAIAERLRQRVERSDFPKRRITISIGVAAYSNEFVEPKDWITAADMALYEAKERGRNSVQNYEDLGRSFREKIH